MIERNLIDKDITKNIKSKYFAQYKENKEIKQCRNSRFAFVIHDPIERSFIKNYEKLSQNNFELHKKYVKEGHNPNEIAKIIRNDEIEKLQEIISQKDFDVNQTIEPSLYERCDFINQENVSLIDYAAFFGSIKCFKYLLMNGAEVYNTGKYAVAGGNIAIIHLCEQNHSSFYGSYGAAIEYHRNDVFKYIYEKELEKFSENIQNNSIIYRRSLSYLFRDQQNDEMYQNINDLGYLCIINGSYEILSFLEKEGLDIDDFTINECVRIGNLYLVKHFLKNNNIPMDILLKSIESENFELVKFILDQKEIDVNVKDIYLLYLRFVLII